MVIFYDNIDATVDVVGVDFDVDTWCLFRLFFAILMLMLILLFRTDPRDDPSVLKAVLMAVLMVVLFFNNYNEGITDNAEYSSSIAASGNSCSRIFVAVVNVCALADGVYVARFRKLERGTVITGGHS